MDSREILETVIAAKAYLNNLNILDKELENAQLQISSTYQETEKIINETFSNLKDNLMNALLFRQNKLLNQAKKIKENGLSPLQDCRNVINDKISNTKKLLDMGELISKGALSSIEEFKTNSSLLGSLPEVPELTQVPFISFQFEFGLESEIKNLCAQFGEISKIAPIQISKVSEKPGAILVEWQIIEVEDKMTDIQSFKLQRAFGNVLEDKHLLVNFVDCYEGLETQCLVKDLNANQPYSFRVCCQFEGSSSWSPWSLPQLAVTGLKPFSWKLNNDYLLSNDNKIVKCLVKDPEVLSSDGPQFHVGHSVEFIFLETDNTEAIVGLVVEKEFAQVHNIKSITNGSFYIEKSGKIFVEGVEKSTKLPEFSKGLHVCFTCEEVNQHKVRINIDSNDKRVTYEWAIPAATKMYFVLQLFSSNWKVMVE